MRWWHGDESPANLRAARVIFAAHALWLVLARDYAATSALPAPFWSTVPLSARWRFLIFPDQFAVERALAWLAVLTLGCVMFNLKPRLACFASGLLLYHLAPLETIYWTPNPYERGLTVAVLALLILAAAREPLHAWGVRLAQFCLVSVYVIAGLAKLVREGPSWVSAENMRRWLLVFVQQEEVAVFRALGSWMVERPSLCATMAIVALAMDFVPLVALFWKRSRIVIVPLLVAVHVSIVLAMNIVFLNLPQLLVFVDWGAVATRARSRWRSSQ